MRRRTFVAQLARRGLIAAAATRVGLMSALFSLGACSCERERPSGAARRDAGGEAEPEPRIVSLSPSTTEAMFAVGAGRLLVGRSSQCDRPAEVKKLPSVGGFANPNVEVILGLRPSLVIGSRGPAGPSLEQTLRGHGIATWFPLTDGVESITRMLRELGGRLDHQADGDRVARGIEGRVAAIRAWAKKRENVSAVMVFDASPLFVAGPGSFGDQLIRDAGGTNVVTEGGAYPTIDVERLLVLDPDVIIDAVAPGRNARSRLPSAAGWSELRAVKQGRVVALASDAALRPGPRIADGLADVARALHHEAPP